MSNKERVTRSHAILHGKRTRVDWDWDWERDQLEQKEKEEEDQDAAAMRTPKKKLKLAIFEPPKLNAPDMQTPNKNATQARTSGMSNAVKFQDADQSASNIVTPVRPSHSLSQSLAKAACMSARSLTEQFTKVKRHMPTPTPTPTPKPKAKSPVQVVPTRRLQLPSSSVVKPFSLPLHVPESSPALTPAPAITPSPVPTKAITSFNLALVELPDSYVQLLEFFNVLQVQFFTICAKRRMNISAKLRFSDLHDSMIRATHKAFTEMHLLQMHSVCPEFVSLGCCNASNGQTELSVAIVGRPQDNMSLLPSRPTPASVMRMRVDRFRVLLQTRVYNLQQEHARKYHNASSCPPLEVPEIEAIYPSELAKSAQKHQTLHRISPLTELLQLTAQPHSTDSDRHLNPDFVAQANEDIKRDPRLQAAFSSGEFLAQVRAGQALREAQQLDSGEEMRLANLAKLPDVLAAVQRYLFQRTIWYTCNFHELVKSLLCCVSLNLDDMAKGGAVLDLLLEHLPDFCAKWHYGEGASKTGFKLLLQSKDKAAATQTFATHKVALRKLYDSEKGKIQQRILATRERVLGPMLAPMPIAH